MKVSAVIVTRGNVDLEPIISTLPYDEVVVWDNSQTPDARVFGRYLAAGLAKNSVIYTQDDDAIFRNHKELLKAYEPGKIIANIESARTGHAWIAWGALFDRNLIWRAIATYAKHYPLDELFYRMPDLAFTSLTPVKRVDLGVEHLDYAYGDDRVYKMPDHEDIKRLISERCKKING